jgi:FKBP-type peptidyl-prolyl cis-trans isomerase
LIEPVQDQVLIAVQELAKNKKYDFIFDKSADVVMLFSNKRYDLSEYIIRVLTRASKRKQAKDKKAKKNAKNEVVVPVVNEAVDARKKAAEDNKAERQRIIDERIKQRAADKEAKKKAFEEKRNKMLAEKEAKKKNVSGVPGLPAEEEK